MSHFSESDIVTCLTNYRREAGMARMDRMAQNRVNFDCFNLRQDWSYKQKGQSREFLPKMSMAVEQAANFLQQGLADLGDWFKVEAKPGLNEDMLKIKPSVVYKLLDSNLKKTCFNAKVGDAAKLGLIGSLMIAKVTGKYVNKPKFVAKTELKNGSYRKKLIKQDEKIWQLDVSLLRQEDYYPDPTGRGLYEMQDIYMDYWEIEKMAKGKDAIYDLEAVERLKGQPDSTGIDKEYQKARETGQNTTSHGYRRQIKLTEIWGTILGPDGEVLYENVVCTVANDQFVIQKPTENPLWHQQSPFVKTAILTVPFSVWGRAMMDAPTMLNRASNEMFNLVLDGGMMAVHGIKQIKKHFLEDASQVVDGIPPGTTLSVNSSMPPGTQVLERVDTSTVPADGLNVLNILNQEFNASALTNDLRMGVSSFRAVKATEIVEASNTITSMFSGMAKNIEEKFITEILNLSWMTCAQHLPDMDQDELKALLGEETTAMLMAMGPAEVFADTVQGLKFETFGISQILNKQKDFTKMTALLQTIASNEVLMEEFMKKNSWSKFLQEIMRSLDINVSKIEADGNEGGDLTEANPDLPDMQSQIPQAGAASNQGDMSPIPQADFPASRATPAGG